MLYVFVFWRICHASRHTFAPLARNHFAYWNVCDALLYFFLAEPRPQTEKQRECSVAFLSAHNYIATDKFNKALCQTSSNERNKAHFQSICCSCFSINYTKSVRLKFHFSNKKNNSNNKKAANNENCDDWSNRKK